MSAAFELEGTVKEIFDLQTFPSGFSKREFVIETADDRYPQSIKFETVKDRTSLLDSLSKGDKVRVSFDIRGNEFKGRYYVNLNAWKVGKAGEGSGSAGPAGPAASQGEPGASSLDASFDNEPDDSDEIPF